MHGEKCALCPWFSLATWWTQKTAQRVLRCKKPYLSLPLIHRGVTLAHFQPEDSVFQGVQLVLIFGISCKIGSDHCNHSPCPTRGILYLNLPSVSAAMRQTAEWSCSSQDEHTRDIESPLFCNHVSLHGQQKATEAFIACFWVNVLLQFLVAVC